MPDEEVYTNRYVAFIDILGFTQEVKNSRQNQGKANQIKKTLNSLHDCLINSPDIHFFAFSDSIIIVSKENVSGDFYANQMFEVVSKICKCLLENHLLCRGGISFGEVYFDKDKNIVFGEAYLKALEIEQKQAFYPRVVLDDRVQAMLSLPNEENYPLCYKDPSDDLFFIHFRDGLSKSKKEEILKFLNCEIMKNLTESYVNKIKWFKKYLEKNF